MYFAPNNDIPAACGCGLERIHPHFLWLLEDFISQEAFFPLIWLFLLHDNSEQQEKGEMGQ